MFYTFSQNNSGGHFDNNNKVCQFVIIEADNANEANKIAEDIGIYFYGVEDGIDCDCCGDRWCPADKYDGKEFPAYYGSPVEDYFTESVGVTSCRVYYKNGVVKNLG